MSELSDLMGIDPLKLARENRDEIVKVLQENRHKFMSTVKAPKAAPATAEEKAAAKEAAKSIKLDNLDLDL